MSSLWTPDGEHRVPPPGTADLAPPDPAGPADPDGFATDDLADRGVGAEDPALAAELAAVEQELLDAPVGDVLANHCYGIFQLAALHLGQQPPHLEDARLAIDAFAALVDGLGDRLGPSHPTLVDGLAQLRLAYVQIAGARQVADPDR